ncbi:3'(2'),5'-bisphosphate nucleotidase CysQ [Alkalibacillus almallahensis]|uniref:3'(2'),5'-bisphosphate nucleotidase CysQ n=1 Tax=Alkalibacillus almallahensis TaxID=1379154 RepID=UPI0014228A92|nr:3'(2'),5'-bisphosphate nucleotidase CysQ [Alkalibacillus almallahensis]NIK11784.1 3'(2'), 5'-bisphosphate nucleotidase [Alkalibacillus almallahensis]
MIKELANIALDAGEEIMEIYKKDFDVAYKEDESPLTIADEQAHAVIEKELKESFPSIPILSEEGDDISYEERKNWKQFFLVDPLDGTKEFIKKNGEFTVNIALVDGGYPSVGVIYAPALDILYVGVVGEGAFKLNDASQAKLKTDEDVKELSHKLPLEQSKDAVDVVASRSHMSEETEAFIEELKAEHGEVETVSSGSSLKFCLVAEGEADYYPRYAPTMEWDTGAGQAIVESVGKKVVRYDDGERFYYNREDLTNGWFLVK